VSQREEVMVFHRQFDWQSFHIDEEVAKRSMHGGGWHTVGMVMRLMCDSYLNQSASLSSPGAAARERLRCWCA
jgi:acyl dehydratase